MPASRRPVPSPVPGASAITPDGLARLHEPLLALHAALEVESLWRATQAVLRAAASTHRITLFLGHIGMGEARVVLTDPPIADPAHWYAARGRDNPFSPFIEAHRGLRFYRFDEVLPPPAEFKLTSFYRDFAAPEGWDKGVSLLYWDRGDLKAMFSLYRAPAQPDFSDADLAAINYVYPFIGIAVDRVRLLHSERLARRGLEEFNKRLPVGLLTLDWEMNVVFANTEGLNACALWNLGPAGARAVNSRDCFALPPAVQDAARRLRDAIQRRNPKDLRPNVGDVTQVAHPAQPGFVVTISASHTAASALAKPRFLLIFDARAAGTAANPSPAALGRLSELTPREREIALLVAEGRSNDEIARQLSKSILTIKTQLNAVFRKLNVNRRAQLMALLR